MPNGKQRGPGTRVLLGRASEQLRVTASSGAARFEPHIDELLKLAAVKNGVNVRSDLVNALQLAQAAYYLKPKSEDRVPSDLVEQVEQRRAARLARPNTPRTWRKKRPGLRVPKTSPSTTGADARCSSSARGNAAGRSAARAPTTSASAGTSQSKDCPIAWARAHCISIGRSAALQRECVSIPPQPRGRAA
jgi:hypothetical protein